MTNVAAVQLLANSCPYIISQHHCRGIPEELEATKRLRNFFLTLYFPSGLEVKTALEQPVFYTPTEPDGRTDPSEIYCTYLKDRTRERPNEWNDKLHSGPLLRVSCDYLKILCSRVPYSSYLHSSDGS